jgi:uncharacterized protein DUF4386
LSDTLVVGLTLIALPVAFNIVFADLARTFDYPDILRREPGEILARFRAGGTALVVRWWAFVLVGVAFIPVGVAAPGVIAPGTTIASVAAALAVAAGLVQVIGLVRWPFLVPELARRHADPDATPERRAMIELVLASVHRLLGVGIGEHLGYLFTGLWTLALSAMILAGTDGTVPTALAIPGALAGLALVVGSLEFVGPNEPRGWTFAEKLVPVAYSVWSIWLVVLGIALII